jgi:protein-arginine deiminase
LTASELRHGVELGIEGRDIVRDSAVWDGTANVSLTVTGNGSTATDHVLLKEAPVLTQLNTQRLQQVLTTPADKDDAEGKEWRSVVEKQAKASGAPLRLLDQGDDKWTQDIFEPAYMSIPGPGGKPQGMKVLLGSVNDDRRVGSRVIFTDLAGHDVAAVHTEHVPVLDPIENSSYDSMGNLETIPATPGHPVGQIVMGGDGLDHKTGPASELVTLLKSQGQQDPIAVDTSWLTIGHVDEFIQFVPVPGSRLSWKAVVADPTAGLGLLAKVKADGHGGEIMHGGLPKLEWPYDLRIDQRSTDEFLADKQFVETNQRAAEKIQANLDVLKSKAGLRDSDFVRVPALYTARSLDYGMLETEISSLPDGQEKDEAVAKLHAMRDAVAEVPGTVNGLVLNAGRYVAPKPFGPVVNGKDVFATAISKAFAGIGYQVAYANELTSVHVSEGEIHCASNTLRDSLAADQRWWTHSAP